MFARRRPAARLVESSVSAKATQEKRVLRGGISTGRAGGAMRPLYVFDCGPVSPTAPRAVAGVVLLAAQETFSDCSTWLREERHVPEGPNSPREDVNSPGEGS